MRALLVVVCTTTLVPLPAGAEARSALSEASWLASFGSSHPALVAERRALLEAEAEAAALRALESPELEVAHESPGRVEQLDLGVSWQPPHPGRRRLAIRAAETRVSAARARLEQRSAAVFNELRSVYARWSVGTAVVRPLQRWTDELERLAKREHLRVQEGESSGLDARRLTLAAGSARARLARAEADRLDALAVVRGWSPTLDAGSTPELPPLPQPTPATRTPHPDLVALEAELAAAAADRELAGFLADMPAVTAGWQRQESEGLTAEGPTLAVRWALPSAGRRQRALTLADAGMVAAEARLQLRRRELEAQREGAFAAYVGLRQAAIEGWGSIADNDLVLEAARASFEAGEADVTDLLDALSSVVEAELAVLEVHQQAAAALRFLHQISGVGTP